MYGPQPVTAGVLNVGEAGVGETGKGPESGLFKNIRYPFNNVGPTALFTDLLVTSHVPAVETP